MDDERTWYEVLGVEPRAAKGDIRTAYQDAIDAATVAENGQELAQVRRAWQVLSDPVQRQRYDEEIGAHLGALEPVATSRDGQVDDDYDDDYDDEDGDDGVEVLDDDGTERRRRPKPSMMDTASFLELPTLGRRFVATVVDALTFLALSALGGIPLGVATGSAIPVLVWVELMIIGVYIVPTFRTGQTLGKRMTYLMTVDRASGNLCSVAQVITRYLVPMAVFPFLFPLGPFLALYFGLSYMMGRDQVSLADRIAKTIVVIARYKPSRTVRGA
jgi:uncharacterized RDD family membrane protein YckC